MKLILSFFIVIIIPIALFTILCFVIAAIVADYFPMRELNEGQVVYPHIASWEDELFAV